VHIDEPVHLRLHDEPHEPEHSFMFAQSSEQLFPQLSFEIVHDWPDGHAHVAPVHFGGVPLLPQAARENASNKEARRIRSS
jgi:hypothetical protein